MKYVPYFSSLTATNPESISWEKMTEVLRSDFLREKTLKYRTLLSQLDKAEASGDKNAIDCLKAEMKRVKMECPAIVCQAELEGGKDKTCIRGYTAYMMADFDHVPADRLNEALAKVKADPCTFIVYTTISGRGFRVIARVDGKVTEENFRAAWLSANEHFKRVTGLDYDTQCSNVTRLCGLAWDSKAEYHPVAKRIKVNLSLDPKRARRGKGAGRPAKAANLGERVRRMVEADGAVYADGCHNDYVSRCIYLMNRYGVTLDDCTSWALGEFDDYAERHPKAIETMVRNVYQNHSEEHATLAANTSNRKASIREMEKFIAARYSIRLNLLSMKLEQCKLNVEKLNVEIPTAQQFNIQSATFNIVDDRFVKSLWRQMQLAGLNADLQTVFNILGSDFVEAYHPFKSWIEGLPAWDGKTDYIRQFFSMVHCLDISEEEFFRYTRCWFLAMVASVMYDDVVNHCILTFIGRQGTYKSTFMLHILPPHLRAFFSTKSNSFQLTKDDRLMLAQNIVISLEEIDSMAPKEINQLKAFTTLPLVNERPPYGHNTMVMPRVASLTATGNNLTFLTDQTGNRRWLPFHVDSIDNPWTADIPYEGMYAQALALIRGGERYWLDDADIRSLNEHNRSFMAPDPATEFIVTYYMHPRTEAETKYLTATKIAARFAPYLKVSPTKIGLAMAELGFEQIRRKTGRFWKVAERPQCDIDSSIPDIDHSEKNETDMPF
ncbi:MAG: VapE family protein [Prevotellaceae bacterium]|nr:VapE family protein [Prevotellaceae bacterium]